MEGPNPRPDAPLAFAVRREDLVQLGFTTGCKGCRATRTGGTQQMHGAHFHEQVMSEIMKTATSQARIEEDEQRTDTSSRGDRATADPTCRYNGEYGYRRASAGRTDACPRGKRAYSRIRALSRIATAATWVIKRPPGL